MLHTSFASSVSKTVLTDFSLTVFLSRQILASVTNSFFTSTMLYSFRYYEKEKLRYSLGRSLRSCFFYFSMSVNRAESSLSTDILDGRSTKEY